MEWAVVIILAAALVAYAVELWLRRRHAARVTDDLPNELTRLGLNVLIRLAHDNAVRHGFAEASFGERIALIHSELSEALEEYRAGHDVTRLRVEDGKPEGVPAELADVAIRLFDMCGAYGIDLNEAVRVKMAYNSTRAYRHGGKKL
jgi:NTP pyrophosphatase (non-canonical NTP hydrolase)